MRRRLGMQVARSIRDPMPKLERSTSRVPRPQWPTSLGALPVLATACSDDLGGLSGGSRDATPGSSDGRAEIATDRGDSERVKDGGDATSMDRGSPSRTTNHTSGSRIRALFAVTSEGNQAWVGWHDKKMDVDCEFVYLDTYRCFPSGTPRLRKEDFAFGDAACTQPVAMLH